MKLKTGNTDAAKTMKAGCGLRYDPEQLSDDTSFDFPDMNLWKTLFKQDKAPDTAKKKCLPEE